MTRRDDLLLAKQLVMAASHIVEGGPIDESKKMLQKFMDLMKRKDDSVRPLSEPLPPPGKERIEKPLTRDQKSQRNEYARLEPARKKFERFKWLYKAFSVSWEYMPGTILVTGVDRMMDKKNTKKYMDAILTVQKVFRDKYNELENETKTERVRASLQYEGFVLSERKVIIATQEEYNSVKESIDYFEYEFRKAYTVLPLFFKHAEIEVMEQAIHDMKEAFADSKQRIIDHGTDKQHPPEFDDKTEVDEKTHMGYRTLPNERPEKYKTGA